MYHPRGTASLSQHSKSWSSDAKHDLAMPCSILTRQVSCPNGTMRLGCAAPRSLSMNTLLLYPEWPDTYWSFKHALPFQGKRSAYPPLGLLTIAALLPAHWTKRLVDTNVCALTDFDLAWADVALVSGMLVQKDKLLVILARCRAHGIRTVVGGPIASGFAELHRYADHVVIGEAEDLIAPLAEDLERGTAKPQYKASEMPSLDRSPLPNLSLINTRHYCSMAIQYSRGCPFNCEFCDIIEIYGRKPQDEIRRSSHC